MTWPDPPQVPPGGPKCEWCAEPRPHVHQMIDVTTGEEYARTGKRRYLPGLYEFTDARHTFAGLYDCCPAAPTQPHTADCPRGTTP